MTSVYPELSEVSSKRRRKFKTTRERNRATRERKRKYDQQRISLGESSAEWREQMSREGYKTNGEFLKHVLAVHQCRCVHVVNADNDCSIHLENHFQMTSTPNAAHGSKARRLASNISATRSQSLNKNSNELL